ncbi:hypothetical protein HY623_02350 [Candidatus Uhrbacteria bacterium]|nr:hypothetical protein [Candidatus Uhrbacteria bacterium]
MIYSDDSEWWESHILAVNEKDTYWETTDTSGLVFFILKKHGVKPSIGETIRYYGSGAPNAIRGVEINGKRCFYETPEQFAERIKPSVTEAIPPPTRENDTNFRDCTIKIVHDIGSYWQIKDNKNLTYNLQKEFGVQPFPGDIIRYYGGSAIYGIDINGKKIFYEPLGDENDEPREWNSR